MSSVCVTVGFIGSSVYIMVHKGVYVNQPPFASFLPFLIFHGVVFTYSIDKKRLCSQDILDWLCKNPTYCRSPLCKFFIKDITPSFGSCLAAKGNERVKNGREKTICPLLLLDLFGAGAGILEQFMRVRNREGTELSHTGPPACVAWRRAGATTLFLAPNIVLKFQLW